MWLYERAISSDQTYGQTYRFNYIPPLIFLDARVKSVNHTDLVSVGGCMHPFVCV